MDISCWLDRPEAQLLAAYGLCFERAWAPSGSMGLCCSGGFAGGRHAQPAACHPLATRVASCACVQVGKGVVRRSGKDVAIVGYGHSTLECLAAAEMLAAAGVSATVVDARFCKPLDTALIRRLAKEHPVMLTVEEGSIGGFAAHVMQVGGWVAGESQPWGSLCTWPLDCAQLRPARAQRVGMH